MPTKALMLTMLVQEHKDKIITHIVQRTELNTTIGFLKHPMFPHSLYPYPTTSPLTPMSTSRSSSHLYPPRIVSIGPFPSYNFFPS